jgi:hypothetical protein
MMTAELRTRCGCTRYLTVERWTPSIIIQLMTPLRADDVGEEVAVTSTENRRFEFYQRKSAEWAEYREVA